MNDPDPGSTPILKIPRTPRHFLPDFPTYKDGGTFFRLHSLGNEVHNRLVFLMAVIQNRDGKHGNRAPPPSGACHLAPPPGPIDVKK